MDELDKYKDHRQKTWSFSAMYRYESCPYQFALERVDKRPQEESYALAKGNQQHALMENYLLDNIQGVPRELQMFSKYLKELKAAGAMAEEKFCLDRHWQPVIGDDKWFNKNTWIRAMFDARQKNRIVDLKSGNEYPHYAQQGDLYATMLFQHDETIDEITVEMWYTKTSSITKAVFKREDNAKNLDKWEDRANKLMNEKFWHPKLNDGCKWCRYQDRCELFQ